MAAARRAGSGRDASREGWKDVDDVACPHGLLGVCLAAVQQEDAVEPRRYPEAPHDSVDRRPGRDVEHRGTVATAGRKEAGEGGEESDFDGHLNPPCPSVSTAGRVATRRRSPGRIRA